MLGCPEFPMATMSVSAFNNCPALVRFRYWGSIPDGVNFSKSPLLDGESVENILAALVDRNGQASQTLTLHPQVAQRLTDAQKAAIAAKNWNLVY